ncbi:MAG TPA: hypothetical protein P5307_26965, partial [Pirellulaceae bacterium]|nr:hypothetical protein [Pirellulaceae bacterium]
RTCLKRFPRDRNCPDAVPVLVASGTKACDVRRWLSIRTCTSNRLRPSDGTGAGDRRRHTRR